MKRSRAPRVCARPGCPELTTAAYCAAHRREQDRRRGSRHERGYGWRHERWRRAVLRLHPLCVLCLDEGRTTVATVADHIVPWQQGGAKYDLANGRGLCAAHHNRVRREQGIGGARRGSPLP